MNIILIQLRNFVWRSIRFAFKQRFLVRFIVRRMNEHEGCPGCFGFGLYVS